MKLRLLASFTQDTPFELNWLVHFRIFFTQPSIMLITSALLMLLDRIFTSCHPNLLSCLQDFSLHGSSTSTLLLLGTEGSCSMHRIQGENHLRHERHHLGHARGAAARPQHVLECHYRRPHAHLPWLEGCSPLPREGNCMSVWLQLTKLCPIDVLLLLIVTTMVLMLFRIWYVP